MNNDPPKTVKFPVYNTDTDEFETLEMDEISYREMCAAEEEQRQEINERAEQARKEEAIARRYDRDDD